MLKSHYSDFNKRQFWPFICFPDDDEEIDKIMKKQLVRDKSSRFTPRSSILSLNTARSNSKPDNIPRGFSKKSIRSIPVGFE